jgi:hypothetical protein
MGLHVTVLQILQQIFPPISTKKQNKIGVISVELHTGTTLVPKSHFNKSSRSDFLPVCRWLRYLGTALKGEVKVRAAYRGRRQVSLDVGDAGRVVRHVGENESLLVVVLTEDFVLAQIEAVAHTEPKTEEKQRYSECKTQPSITEYKGSQH